MQSLLVSVSLLGNKINPATLDLMGTRCGIAGSLMLASNTWVSAYGYVLFLLSSIFLLGWAIATKLNNQVKMQAVFFGVNMLGLYNWLIV